MIPIAVTLGCWVSCGPPDEHEEGTYKPPVMKTMMTPHLVAVGSCVRMKTQKGMNKTERSVRITKAEVDVMKAALSILCLARM